MIIDATNLVIGRLSSFVAKQALRGQQIDIVNSEKAVVTGSKENIQLRYKMKFERGSPLHGPYRSKREDMFLKRTIRGMLPHKQAKGRNALNKIKCYIGIPPEMRDKKIETIKEANVAKTQSLKYMTIEQVCKFLGRK